jgi:hypothetical protein
VLNTLTEQDFQDAFKNCRSAGNGAYWRKGTTSRVMVASRPKVSFDEMAAPVLGTYNVHLTPLILLAWQYFVKDEA